MSRQVRLSELLPPFTPIPASEVTAATFEARSRDYAMVVEVIPPAEASGDVVYSVRYPGSLSASVTIQKGDTIVDSMHARWATQPCPAGPRALYVSPLRLVATSPSNSAPRTERAYPFSMRWPLLLLLVPALAFAATPATFETRSQDYAMVVDVVSAGVNGDATVAVRVTDLHTNELLASPRIEVRGAAEATSDVRDMKIRIVLHMTPGSLSASVEIRKGDTILDSMESRWATKPVRTTRMVPTNPPPSGDGPFSVGGDVKAPVLISRVEPIYTEEARKANISGIVIAQAMIDKSGDVRDVKIFKPLPFGLDQAAIDALRQWKYRPGTLNGQPVDVLFNVVINFDLDTPKPAAPPAQ